MICVQNLGASMTSPFELTLNEHKIDLTKEAPRQVLQRAKLAYEKKQLEEWTNRDGAENRDVLKGVGGRPDGHWLLPVKQLLSKRCSPRWIPHYKNCLRRLSTRGR